LLGKGFSETIEPYDRLPVSLEGKTRPEVWALSKNSSGIAVRFRSNSRVIAARWEVVKNTVMNHFAPSGIKGLDLYCFDNGGWRYVNTGLPAGKISEKTFIINMKGENMEYMLYLPLYDGLKKLEIGVEKNSYIENPEINSPRREKPVVFYGTSITQGGCASRPGMAYPSLLSRMLDRQTINLGFSGNGRLDLEIAEAIATIDASCIVIDCLPNSTPAIMKDNYIRFFEIIKKANPDVPVVMVENLHNTTMYFNIKVKENIIGKNNLLRIFYKDLKNRGYKNITYVKAKGLTGKDMEETVDGVHLTDLGFSRMAKSLYPVIRKQIK
jgi:lysophospholipase L1-like esterase